MITTRLLERAEVERVWEIDRREVIEQVYYLRDGALVLLPEYYDITGWHADEVEKYTPLLHECHQRGGWFCAAFDGATLAGVAVLDPQRLGSQGEQVQLKFLHVSRNYRSAGLGMRLFELASQQARRWGARRLYISATPSQHTVDFYTRCGAYLAPQPDPALFALEPEDIHLLYDL